MSDYSFHDFYHNEVSLSFKDHPYSKYPKHVWVICRLKNEWLLTKHSRRGLEFPGGKVEVNEIPIEAAMREVWEETGGIVENIDYIGQYEVKGRADTVQKNIYFATISHLEQKEDYLETYGPFLLKCLPTDIQRRSEYSFIMKDNVLTYSLQYLHDQGYVKLST